jgi:hypothetical protein
MKIKEIESFEERVVIRNFFRLSVFIVADIYERNFMNELKKNASESDDDSNDYSDYDDEESELSEISFKSEKDDEQKNLNKSQEIF